MTGGDFRRPFLMNAPVRILLHSSFFILRSAFICFLVAATAHAAPPRPYHLQLEANPAPFPFLGRFGTVTLHVYPHGVRANTFWLNGFSRNGSETVTVMNPVARMYAEVPIVEFPAVMARLTGAKGGQVQGGSPVLSAPTAGRVRGFAASRYRLVYGPNAWIDIWTTQIVPENPQLKKIVYEFVSNVAPATADLMRTIPGNPLYVELNFSHYHRLPLLRLRSLTMDSRSEAAALEVGALYFKAPLLDSIWK
jgi:hypothetical protein